MNPWIEKPNHSSVLSLLFSNVIVLLAVVVLACEIVFLTEEISTLLHDWQTLAALKLLY